MVSLNSRYIHIHRRSIWYKLSKVKWNYSELTIKVIDDEIIS